MTTLLLASIVIPITFVFTYILIQICFDEYEYESIFGVLSDSKRGKKKNNTPKQTEIKQFPVCIDNNIWDNERPDLDNFNKDLQWLRSA